MDWTAISGIATSVTSLGVIITLVQLTRETRVQNTQSFFYLHGYLSQQDFSTARKHVRTDLTHKEYSLWDEADKQMANMVCASYDQTGILIELGILDKSTETGFLRSSWGESIVDQFEVLRPFLNDMQTPHQTGREFFHHFTELYTMAKPYHLHKGGEGAPG